MDAVHTLYVKAHARNFLLIDLPPMGRSPGGAYAYDLCTNLLIIVLYPRPIALDAGSESALAELVKKWNEHLHSCCKAFAESTPLASITTFSAHAVTPDIPDNPEEYEFTEDDVIEAGSNIWSDELHLTAEVHNVLAEKIINSLSTSEVDEPFSTSCGDGDSGPA